MNAFFAALFLVTLSSFLHAGWNALMKRSKDPWRFVTVSLWFAVPFYVPFFLWFARGQAFLFPVGICAVMTGLLFTLYFRLLAAAYQRGDLSVVYPIARGIAPLFVTFWGLVFLRERVTPLGLTGVASILLGTACINFSIPQAALSSFRSRAMTHSAVSLALLTALTISLYSVVDKIAITYLHPGAYIFLPFLFCTVAMTTLHFRAPGRAPFRDIWQTEGVRVVLAGVFNIAAYLLVLFALQGLPVTYLVPMRSLSLLIGVFLGAWWLGEKGFWVRLMGSALMVGGISLIGLKG